MRGRAERLPGAMLARTAKRIVTPEAYLRVLQPLLADYQFELSRAVGPVGRARVRAIWLAAFWRSLAAEGVRAGGLHLAGNAWGTTEDERATTRVVFRCLVLSIAWLALLVVVCWLPRGAPDRTGAQFLLPSIFAFVFPVACLFAVLVAGQWRGSAGLRLRSVAGVASLAGVVSFANLAWVTPEANYAFKQALWMEHSRLHPEVQAGISRGDREMSVNALVERAANLRDRSRFAEAAYLEVEFHKKPALAAWCLAFAVLGAALVRRVPRAVLRWGVALASCWAWYVLLRLGEQAADAGRVAAVIAMWAPFFVVSILVVMALWRVRSTPTQP